MGWAMDAVTLAKYQEFIRRAEAMRLFAAEKPHLCYTLNEEAYRLEEQATALLDADRRD